MFVIIGLITVIAGVFGGYAMGQGKFGVLWQPHEYVIILGAALGAFLAANPKHVILGAGKALGQILKGDPYNKSDFLELLTMMYQVFKVAKTKGLLALEAHIEKPEESSIFSAFPKFQHNHHALVFFCDYLRLLSLGTENPHELSDIMDEEIELHLHHGTHIGHAVQGMADGTPALGIVAAVLGVIKTMGSITEPPEVLGKLIGGALVGTFFGVFAAYGFFAPLASAINNFATSEAKYFKCLKVGIIAHISGYAPMISVEFARKALDDHVRPSFQELEEATQNLPSTS